MTSFLLIIVFIVPLLEFGLGFASNAELVIVLLVFTFYFKIDKQILIFGIILTNVYLMWALISMSDFTVFLPILLTLILIFGRPRLSVSNCEFDILILFAFACIITAWLQALGFLDPDLFNSKRFYSRIEDINIGRTAGIISNKSSFAMICVMSCLVLYSRATTFKDQGATAKQKIAVLGIIFFSVSLFIPQGRSELPIALAFILLAFPLLLIQKDKVVSLIYILMFVIACFLILYYWENLITMIEYILSSGGSYRSKQVEDVRNIIANNSIANILFGIGLDQYQVIYGGKTVHHYFWKMLLELGLLSVFLCGGLTIIFIKNIWLVFKSQNRLNRIIWVSTVCSSMAIIITHASSVNNAYFYFTIFITVLLAEKVKNAH